MIFELQRMMGGYKSYTFALKCVKRSDRIINKNRDTIIKIYESAELDINANYMLLTNEITRYVHFIFYLTAQQYIRPFRHEESYHIIKQFEKYCDERLIPVHDTIQKIKLNRRMTDYEEVVMDKIPAFGQSLYNVFDDEQFELLKSDAFGRCALLFTDFIYFNLINLDYASLEDIKPLIILDITKSFLLKSITSRVLLVAIEIIRDVQKNVKKIAK